MRRIKGKRCLIIFIACIIFVLFFPIPRNGERSRLAPDISCRMLRRVVLISNGARKFNAYPSTHRSQYLYFLICENSIALYRCNVKCVAQTDSEFSSRISPKPYETFVQRKVKYLRKILFTILDIILRRTILVFCI